ncbi:uncharacterized protein NP_3172A [Natronomonas pharaonis DSM 2160]|uniref:Uncharacterized protein n=1 Tax=Natronomonas pharaonis (strain ATCC 35678 / DSM 2160 / CIP 103997 / JCM 8858 / NBRC 14720 / NCIMB 2260 / Gabara) TaxID=348780 RepID=A0A1U7EX48_NATPD|nr:DUF5813 family protein [Natronomonas pharaonis]CAI49677.2 uncharacterized protein NP_3172A [Natronomonas pharaonis DSM 2160]
MSDELPEKAVRAFERHDAFERDGEWFTVTTTTFDGRVTAEETDDWALSYTVEVRAPMLSSATEEVVGPAVEDGWFDTYDRRLEDAPMAVRQDLELDEQRVFEEAGDAVAVFGFEWGNADHVPDMTKAIAEYVEGTYMEGIVPGYEYGQPVSEMLSQARQSAGESGRGPMPL